MSVFRRQRHGHRHSICEKLMAQSVMLGTLTSSKGMLAVARGSAEKEGVVPYVKFIQHDITCLDTLPPGTLREEGYDIITCASALPLLDDPGAAMRHWAGYLAAGGMLVVDAPTERSAIPGLVFEHVMRELNAKSRLPWSRQWIRNASSLEDLVRSAGLEIERSEILSGFESGGIFNVGQAAEMFQKLMGGPAASELRELGDEFKDKAEDLFIETWKKHAIEGEIREEEGFYLVIGRKPG